MPEIFISYRREDAVAHAGRLYDRLAGHFGAKHVFMDIDTIQPGEDFVDVLEKTVGSCDVLIAIIGKKWVGALDERGRRRLESSEDFLRSEIEIALRRNVRVIPVLVQGAEMPVPADLPEAISPLSRRHAFQLPDTGFHRAINELIAAIEAVTAQGERVGAGERLVRASKEQRQIPRSKLRRALLLYQPPKIYGWILRFYFLFLALWYAMALLLVSISLLVPSSGKQIFGGNGDTASWGLAGVAVALVALGLRFVTVRVERKFIRPTQT